MKRTLIFTVIICYAFAKTSLAQSQNTSNQTLSGAEVIAKSISYHDPNSNWNSFQGEFTLELEMPDKPSRKSIITIDLPKEYFNLTTEQDGEMSVREITGDNCKYIDASSEIITSTTDHEDCARTLMFKNYYSYLYGLPMKLKDDGTHINSSVKKLTFKGKEYLVVQVTYDESIGTDVWHFYFDSSSYAMEVYQFFKGGKEKTGEYILLSGLQTINGIKMPKDRAWYYNKDDGYLGTDRMISQ